MNLSDIMDVNIEAHRVHIANEKWWINIITGERLNRDKGEQLMLVVTELSEAMEGARQNLMDDKLPQYKMEHVEIIDAFIRMLDYRFGHKVRKKFDYVGYPGQPVSRISGELKSYGDTLMAIVYECSMLYIHDTGKGYGVDVVMCDHIINMLFWFACWRGFANQFREIYEAKMAYNATRVDHSIEHRLGEHGKKI